MDISIKTDLTRGRTLRKVIGLSVPVLIGNIIFAVYCITDMIWLGILGKDHLAAATFATPIIFFVVSVGAGFCASGAIIIAQYEGAGNKDYVCYAAGQSLLFTTVLAAIISLCGIMLSSHIIRVMGATEKVVAIASPYIKIILSGVILMYGFLVFSFIMRGWGNTKIPMMIIVVSSIINIILDPVLIFGLWIFPEMGLNGSAVATVISGFIASTAGFYILFSGRYERKIELRSLKPDLPIMAKMIGISSPIAVEQLLKSIGLGMMAAITAGFGTICTASYGIGFRALSAVLMPAFAMSAGVSAGAGQNIGAAMKKRASRLTVESALFIFILLSIVSVAILLNAEVIIRLFFLRSGDVNTINASVEFLRSFAVIAPFIGMIIILRSAFNGAGKTKHAMYMSLSSLFIVKLPAAYFLSLAIGPLGIRLAFIIGSLAELLICIIYFIKADWMKPVYTNMVR